MTPFVDQVRSAALAPLDALFGADERIFLPFLVSAALIAAVVWAISVRPHGRTSLLRYLFAREVWLHRSAILDYQILFVRGLIRLLVSLPAFLSTIAIALWSARMLRTTFGITANHASPALVATLFTTFAFVADDFTRYLVHRVMHRVPMLWELHKVHHSAEVLTPITLHRVHPIEGMLMAVRATITLGLVTGLFVWLFPGRVRGHHVLSVDVIGFAFAVLGANLRHSQVWLSYGPLLERFFISPAQHQIHHSAAPEHHDRNFGATLAVWDWMFRSLFVTRGWQRLTFGLGAAKNHRDGIASVMIDPLRAAGRTLARKQEPERRCVTIAE